MTNLKFEKDGKIGVVSFNRPQAMNALNTETLLELSALLDEIALDDELSVIIFTGEGKAFIAGADIKEMATLNAEDGRQFGVLGQGVFRKLEKLEKVTIAAVNGFALGGGMELAMSCDMRFASEKAKFGQPEVTLGITPGFAGTQRLPRLVGPARAKELIFTGKMVDANYAKSIGLINDIYENLLEDCKGLAKKISYNAPLAVKYAKSAIDVGLDSSIDQGNDIESMLFGLCFATEDQKIGMNAFINKERAEFKNK